MRRRLFRGTPGIGAWTFWPHSDGSTGHLVTHPLIRLLELKSVSRWSATYFCGCQGKIVRFQLSCLVRNAENRPWVPCPGDTLAVHLLSALGSPYSLCHTLLRHVSRLCKYCNGLATSFPGIVGQVVRGATSSVSRKIVPGGIPPGNGISELDGRPDMSGRRGAGALYGDDRVAYAHWCGAGEPPSPEFRYPLPC